ncbi:MAG: hypothetical protein ACYTGH_06800 [Planctomycetota bacterium]
MNTKLSLKCIAVCALLVGALLGIIYCIFIYTLPIGRPQQPVSSLGLEVPVELVGTSYYLDGGTSAFSFRDAKDRTLNVFFDNRMSTKTRCCFYEAAYPGGKGAVLIPKGSAKDKDILSLLQFVVDSNMSLGEQWLLPLFWEHAPDLVRHVYTNPPIYERDYIKAFGVTQERE